MSPVEMVPVTDEMFEDARQLSIQLIDLMEQSGLDEARCGMAIAIVLGGMAGYMPIDKREAFFQAVTGTVNRIVEQMNEATH